MKSNERHPATPFFYMMVSVAAFSVIPVLIKLGGAENSPFLFTGIRQVSIGVAMVATILLIRKPLVARGVIQDIGFDVIRSNWSSSITIMLIAGIAGTVSFVLLAFGLGFVDVSIVAILFETWPVFLILLMSFLFYDKTKGKDRQRYQPITISTMIFVAVAIAGVAMVILGHNDTLRPISLAGVDFTSRQTVIGVAFALAAAIGGALQGGFTLKAGEVMAERHSNKKYRNAEEIIFVIVMTAICEILGGGMLCLAGLVVSETISMHQLSYTILTGVVITVGMVAFRAAMLNTRDLGLTALSYVTPLITLVWLWILSLLSVSHLDYLIIGAMGIAAANLLINVDASKRLAYKALVVCLWLFGTVTYLTDGYTTDVPLELPVTIFILVLAFRVDRLARRTSQEEEWLLDAFRRIRFLASQKPHNSDAFKTLADASQSLLAIDYHKSLTDLKAAYVDTTRKLNNAPGYTALEGEVADIQRMVDKLAHSRQQGSRFGEIVAIFLTGVLIVFGLLVFNGDSEIYGEIISFVLSSVIVFLFFNIMDLQADRKDRTLVEEEKGEYIVNFGEVKNTETQQYISMVISCVIVLLFVCLFFVKG